MVVLLQQFVGISPDCLGSWCYTLAYTPVRVSLFYPSVLNAFTLQQLPLHTFVNLDEKPLARVLSHIGCIQFVAVHLDFHLT